MTIYWLIYIIPALAALFESRLITDITNKERLSNLKLQSLAINIYGIFLILVIGFRHEVGGDWFHYLEPLNRSLSQDIDINLITFIEPGYMLLNMFSAYIGGGIYLVNLVCSILFVLGLINYARNSPNPWLTLCIAAPYLVIVVAMGYTRQGVAIGMAMIGIISLTKGNLFHFAFWLIIASLFHKSALVLMPMVIFCGMEKKGSSVLGVLLLCILMYILLIGEELDRIVSGYITDQYESSGATIRIFMNFLPATIYLIFHNRFKLTYRQKKFWIWMSLGSIALLILLVLSPSSTAVDRIALYWIPLQLFVWGRLPNAMGKKIDSRRQWVVIILIYTFLTQYIWLFYADNKHNWLPYKFYPWEWIWI